MCFLVYIGATVARWIHFCVKFAVFEHPVNLVRVGSVLPTGPMVESPPIFKWGGCARRYMVQCLLNNENDQRYFQILIVAKEDYSSNRSTVLMTEYHEARLKIFTCK